MGTPHSPPIADATRSHRAQHDSTRIRPALDGFARTNGVDEAGETGTWNGEVRLRPAPAGYDLFRYLGGGGGGDVYLAREHAAERTVAMKFLRGAPNTTSADRFRAEVRALARLDHPNIVRVISVDLDRPDPHFTMEYGEGGTLGDRVKAKGPLPPEEAARLMAIVARAVDVAHGANILHRDLKPSNIVLAADDTPKITDFGLAKRTDLDGGLSLSTGPLGTPAYMPPEQVSSRHGQPGPTSDVYGLGATLYHLLTARPPFQGESAETIIDRVVKEAPERVRSIRPEVPLGLEAIVHKCLEKVQSNRYPSSAALAADLDRYLAGQTPVAPHLTRVHRASRWVLRNRRRVAAAAGVLALVVSVFFVGRVFAPDPPASAPPRDILEEVRKELAAGKPVELIGQTGPPLWYQSHFLPANVLPPNEGEGAFVCSSFDLSLIELLPDPGIPKYRIRAELKHITGNGPRANAQIGLESIGVYFGADAQRTADGRDAVTLFNIYFNDFTPRVVPGLPAIPTVIRYAPGLIIDVGKKAERGAGQFWLSGADDLPFTPTPGRPGPWRKIAIDVSAEKVVAYWGESPNGKLKLIAEWPGDEVRTRYAGLQERLTLVSPGPVVRPWSPGRSLGVWCYRSVVAVRNFAIEPVP